MIQDRLEAIAAQLRITSAAVDVGEVNDRDVAILLNDLASQLDKATFEAQRARIESAVR